MINEQTPMPDLLAAMNHAEPVACYEFCCRQRAANLPALADGARLLGQVAHRLQCERPDELMAWKFPETFEPIPGEILPVALDAAAHGDADRAYDVIRHLDFASITAIASVAAHLGQSARHLLAYPHRQTRIEPQGSLF